jgi:hypothetical protein
MTYFITDLANTEKLDNSTLINYLHFRQQPNMAIVDYSNNNYTLEELANYLDPAFLGPTERFL